MYFANARNAVTPFVTPAICHWVSGDNGPKIDGVDLAQYSSRPNSCRLLLAVVDGAHESVRKTEVGKVPKSIGIQVGPSEVRVTHNFNQFDFNAGAEL